jgi:hypothetical protein
MRTPIKIIKLIQTRRKTEENFFGLNGNEL